MSAVQIIFYVFAAMLLFAAFRVITARNTVHCALYLILAFVCSSAIWLILEAEFLAITLVLVYVGAVMVLFLFVVMMLDVDAAPLRERFAKYAPIGAVIAAALIVQMLMVIGPKNFGLDSYAAPVALPATHSNTEELGMALYTNYIYPFEIAGAILLVAIIAAIALTMRSRPNTRYQNPGKQIQVRKEDRLRVIKMETEK